MLVYQRVLQMVILALRTFVMFQSTRWPLLVWMDDPYSCLWPLKWLCPWGAKGALKMDGKPRCPWGLRGLLWEMCRPWRFLPTESLLYSWAWMCWAIVVWSLLPAVGQHAICTLAQMKEDEYVITCHNIIITSYNICTWKLSQTNNVWEWCWESVRLPKHDMEEALAARHVQRDPELQWESCAVQICRARHSSKASQLPWVSQFMGAIWCNMGMDQYL